MTSTSIQQDDAVEATRLLFVYAASNKRVENADHLALVRRYRDDRSFKSTVDAMAAAMKTEVVEEGASESEGLVISTEADSPLAFRWKDLHLSLDVSNAGENAAERRAHLLAAMIGVAATFFPHPRSQYQRNAQQPSADVPRCVKTIEDAVEAMHREIARREEAGEPEPVDATMVFAHSIGRLQPFAIGRDDRSLKTIGMQVKKVLETLVAEGLVSKKMLGDEPIYFARERYRLQISSCSTDIALEFAQVAASGRKD